MFIIKKGPKLFFMLYFLLFLAALPSLTVKMIPMIVSANNSMAMVVFFSADQSKKPWKLHGTKMAILVTSVITMSLLLSISLLCWLVKRRTKGR